MVYNSLQFYKKRWYGYVGETHDCFILNNMHDAYLRRGRDNKDIWNNFCENKQLQLDIHFFEKLESLAINIYWGCRQTHNFTASANN